MRFVLIVCVILGYVLAEVRLYKKLKTDLDGKMKCVSLSFEYLLM